MSVFGRSGSRKEVRIAAYLLIVVATAQACPVRASDAALLGEWEQVASNAGACPTCRIVFQAMAAGLAVSANNGWAARVSGTERGEASGTGRRDDGRTAWVSGRPFTIRFRIEGDRLVMTMTVETSTDPTRVVRARYKRVWQDV